MTRPSFSARDYHGTGPENYEKYFVPAIGGPLARGLIASAVPRPGERILDVACGTGVVARLAAERVGPTGSVAGLDVNPAMLSVARAVTPTDAGIDWYETSAEAMPLPDASFNVALCQLGLQFVADKEKALKEIRRILQPGGRVVLNLPGPTPALFAILAEALATHIDASCAGFVNVVFSLHDGDVLHGLMTDAGFSDVVVDRTQTTLRLPAPQDFLWQYIHSTPLAALVGKASDEQRSALESEITARWLELVTGGALLVDVGITTVHAK